MLGCYGHPNVKTPNLDNISSQGVRFKNAYCASPLCCPSRSALATGRFPHQTGYWDNALTYDGKNPTWHHRIREQGKVVTAIGKLHFRSQDDDNGFLEEIKTMHIVDGKGAMQPLLRATPEGVPPRDSFVHLYANSGIGEADYQNYDRQISESAIQWLQTHGANITEPWVLLVSYASPHPPFRVPKRFVDLYPLEDVRMPVQWNKSSRPNHPAIEYIRKINGYNEPFEEDYVRRAVAGYCALISFTDEQIGSVINAAEELGLLNETRILYTSDHGDAVGSHGIFGKSNQYEHSVGVPLIMSGPDIPAGATIDQVVSHVDLFSTILEGVGCEASTEDQQLLGRSLWPAIGGKEDAIIGFSEFHAMSSKTGNYLLRDGGDKLIYHVDMPNQYFDLDNDPLEIEDRIDDPKKRKTIAALERQLRLILDPEEVDRRAKSDQRAHIETLGGVDICRKAGTFAVSPIPGKKVKLDNI